MGEETKTAIDLLLESDEADVAKLLEQQKVGEGETSLDPEAVAAAETEEGGTDKVDDDEAAKAAELKAAADAKAAEEEAAKQAEADKMVEAERLAKEAEEKAASEKTAADEKRREDNKRWQEFRRLKREAKEREEREAKEKAEAEAKKAAETSPDELDPIERAQRDAAEAKEMARQAQERAERAEREAREHMAQREAQDEITRQEAAFKQTNPDYDERMHYVIDNRRAQLEVMGLLDEAADKWIEARPDLVEQHARESGKNPEDAADIREAAKDIAFRLAIHTERQQLIQNCRARGKNIAQAVSDLAEKMGYRPKEVETKPAPEVKPQPSAQQKVQAAKEAAERQKPFAQNITNMTGNTAPGNKTVTSRQELMNLPDAEQDALIAKMDRENPGWFAGLED